MSEEPKVMDSSEWSLLFPLSVLWGGAFFFVGIADKELPPLTVVFARVVLATLFLLPLFWYRPQAAKFGERMDAVCCDGTTEQRSALLFSICGSNLHYGWSYIDRQRDDASIYRHCDGRL